MKRVLITGPESTGKSELAMALAQHYGGITVPEYAREYVEKLDGPCSYSDVEHIARWQQDSYNRSISPGTYVFFDTCFFDFQSIFSLFCHSGFIGIPWTLVMIRKWYQ